MSAFTDWLADLFYPAKCMFCGRLLEDDKPGCCDRCIQNLPEFDGVGRSVEYFDGCISTFRYETPVREAILQYKFHGTHTYARVFGTWLANGVLDQSKNSFDLISWVPCSSLRKWQRGYDQAEKLAAVMAEALGLPLVRTLKKRRHNKPQSGLTGAEKRRANVIGVYEAYRPENYAGKIILLVDDVLTTGATLSECGKVLRISGAESLVCAVIACTEQEKNK